MNTFFFYLGLFCTMGNLVFFIIQPGWLLGSGVIVGFWSIWKLGWHIINNKNKIEYWN